MARQPPVVVVSGGDFAVVRAALAWMTRTTRQANHAGPFGEWGLRVGAAWTQTSVLAKGGAENSAEEVEEPELELGLAGVRGPPRTEARHGAGTTTQVARKALSRLRRHDENHICSV